MCICRVTYKIWFEYVYRPYTGNQYLFILKTLNWQTDFEILTNTLQFTIKRLQINNSHVYREAHRINIMNRYVPVIFKLCVWIDKFCLKCTLYYLKIYISSAHIPQYWIRINAGVFILVQDHRIKQKAQNLTFTADVGQKSQLIMQRNPIVIEF